MPDMGPTSDRVRVVGNRFLEVDSYVSLPLLHHSPGGDIIVQLSDVVYVLELCFDRYSL